jgi:hypothetical protein
VSNINFIAWSLVASGIAAIVIFATSRIVLMAMGKPPYRPRGIELFFAFVLALLIGPMILSLIVDLILQVAPPRWTSLLFGPTLLFVGFSNLIGIKNADAERAPAKTLAYVLLGLGLVILVSNFYLYLFTART